MLLFCCDRVAVAKMGENLRLWWPEGERVEPKKDLWSILLQDVLHGPPLCCHQEYLSLRPYPPVKVIVGCCSAILCKI